MNKKLLAGLLIATIMVSGLSGCTPKDTTQEVSTEVKTASELFDENGKYKEMITVTGIGSYGGGTAEDPNFPKDVTIEKFPYLDALRENLNINFERLWLAPAEQFAQKFGVAMASGDLPDIMQVSSVDYEILKENGQLADLSGTLQYANDTLKEYLSKDPSVLESLKEPDGKLYVIPQYFDTRREMNMLYIRQDWLDELGLQVPKTVEELEQVMKAFMEKKNAKQGIALSGSSVVDWGNDVRGLLNMFGAAPGAWLDQGGKLVAGEVQPEAKDGLTMLAKWYKDGLINKEFVTMDVGKAQQGIIAGETGIIVGPWWLYESCMNLAMQKDPAAKWTTAPIPSFEGKGKPMVPRVAVAKYFVVNSECKNPEALVKLMNFSIESNLNAKEYVKKGYKWQWDPGYYVDPFDIQTVYDKFNKALEADPTATGEAPADFTEQEKSWWDDMDDFIEYTKGNTALAKDKEGIFGVINARIYNKGGWAAAMEFAKPENVMYNEFYGAPTETMKEKSSTLSKLRDETYLKIIMGELPIDAFDKYVEDWTKLGGEEITQEVNEWYSSNK